MTAYEMRIIDWSSDVCSSDLDASALKATVDLLSQTPGIATVISATVSANLPELGHCSRRAICALAGAAPIANDSGKHHGQRHIAGGRAVVRTALYQAGLSGVRPNPPLNALYERITARSAKRRGGKECCGTGCTRGGTVTNTKKQQ